MTYNVNHFINGKGVSGNSGRYFWMFPLAIACGNTFVLKPSEKDPSCPLRLVELFKEAGGPEGVVNLINGDQEAVNVLLTQPDIAAVSFVGSTPAAEYIYKTATALYEIQEVKKPSKL